MNNNEGFGLSHKLIDAVREAIKAESVNEKITAKTSTSDVVSDFVDSKNPMFRGKSKAERISMALGAAYNAKKTKTNV